MGLEKARIGSFSVRQGRDEKTFRAMGHTRLAFEAQRFILDVSNSIWLALLFIAIFGIVLSK